MAQTLSVLFLCTGNSARSIMAEAITNAPTIGGGRLRGFSAGSHPKGAVHPLALELLRDQQLDAEGLRSKSWDEFAQPGAPAPDVVITVCDQAAAEACPVWPGHPLTAHWGVPDPAAVEGSEAQKRQAFRQAFATLRHRIERLAALPVEKLSKAALLARIREIAD